MQSPDGKRSSIRLTLKTSGLVQPSAASPETASSPATRHRRTRRRSSVNLSDDESKFHLPALPDELGNWEEFLLAKFQLLREMKEKTDISDTLANRVSTPVISEAENAATSGESAREHAIKLVLSGHLRLESHDSGKKCVISRKRSMVTKSFSSVPQDTPTAATSGGDEESKPEEQEVQTPITPLKLPKVLLGSVTPSNKTPSPQPQQINPEPLVHREKDVGDNRKRLFIRGVDLTEEKVKELFSEFTGYLSHFYQGKKDSSDQPNAIVDFDKHANAVNALKSIKTDSPDLYACLSKGAADLDAEMETFSQEQESEQITQQWQQGQKKQTVGDATASSTSSQQPSMAPRELQTYEDVF